MVFFGAKGLFEYSIIVHDAQKQEIDNYIFPIQDSLKPSVDLTREGSVAFELHVDQSLTLVLTFDTSGDNFDEASEFKSIVSRLNYQARTKRSYRECKNLAAEMDAFFVYKDTQQNKPPVFTKQLENLFAEK